ncbi:MAG: DUF4384 domain-containing protein [Desulfobacterales bacterium]|jgi:hypothetical protein
MIQKNNARIFWMAAALSLFLVIPGVGYSSNYPQWLQAYHDGTLNLTGVYYGVGSADFIGDKPSYDNRKLSKDRALDELCYQLSVSVKSELKEDLVQKGQYSEQQVASSLFVESRKVFSGIREKQNWADPQKSVYWVMVVIDKAKADRQVKQQDFVNEVVDRLENNQREIVAGIKKMTVVLNQQMQFYKKRMNNFEKLLTTINQKVGSAGAQTQAEYTNIKSEITKLGSQWNKQEQMLRDQNKKMEALMSQNKALQDLIAKISKNIQRDHLLALTQDDIRNQSKNPEFTVGITSLKGQGAVYFDGESIRFRVQASRDCYIKVIYLSSINDEGAGETRMNTLLFPNPHDRNNFIRAGTPTIIGRKDELLIQKPYGKDIITVVASTSQFTDMEESLRKAAASGGYYQEETRSVREAVNKRGVGVKSSITKTSTDDTGSHVSDTCFIITRK